MKVERPFIEIDKRIAHNIVELRDVKGVENLLVDDVLICVWDAVVYLDITTLNPEDWRLKHISSMKFVLKNKKTILRYRSYSRDVLRSVLAEEQLSKYSEEEDTKTAFLSDIRLIESIDDNGLVKLNDRFYSMYKNKIAPVELQYGTFVNVTRSSRKKNSKVKSEIIESYSLPSEAESVLLPYIESYCEDWEKCVDMEDYKWYAVKKFNDRFKIDADNLAANLHEALSPAGNLLAGPYYYPKSMLVQLANLFEDEVRVSLMKLFDETVVLGDRIDQFLADIQYLLEEGIKKQAFKSTDKGMQSVRSISVYLALRYPNKHYLYKQSLYYDFSHETGLNLPSLRAFKDNLSGYEMVCDEMRKVLLKNQALIDLHDKSYPDDISNYHLLTQDFLYYCAYHFNTLHKS